MASLRAAKYKYIRRNFFHDFLLFLSLWYHLTIGTIHWLRNITKLVFKAGAHQMDPPSPIQALGVNPFPFIWWAPGSKSKIGSPLESSVRDVATKVNDFSFLSQALLALLRSLRAPAGHCFRDSRSTCQTSAERKDRFHCHATKK